MFGVLCRALQKLLFSSIVCIDLGVLKSLQVKCSLNCHVVLSGWWVLRALKVFCLAKYVKDLEMNIELSAKAKYVVNAENFKCNILIVSLINLNNVCT